MGYTEEAVNSVRTIRERSFTLTHDKGRNSSMRMARSDRNHRQKRLDSPVLKLDPGEVELHHDRMEFDWGLAELHRGKIEIDQGKIEF